MSGAMSALPLEADQALHLAVTKGQIRARIDEEVHILLLGRVSNCRYPLCLTVGCIETIALDDPVFEIDADGA